MFGLLNRGEYAKVIDLMQEVISKHQGKKSYENAAFYNIALCYFQMGDFEKSLQYLDRMDPNRLNKKMKTAYFMAYAGNLISLKRDLEAARQYLKEAYKIVPYSMIYLSMAIVEKLLGNNEDSKTLLEKYLSTKDNMKSKYGLVMLYVDQYSKMIAENFMLGWLYYLNGEHNKAIPYLEVARQCKYENYAAKKARELLRLLEPSSALAD